MHQGSYYKTQQSTFWVMIPAAGQGTRFRATHSAAHPATTADDEVPSKQYHRLSDNCTIAQRTMEQMQQHPAIAGCVVALSAQDRWFQQMPRTGTKPVYTTTGGACRAASVLHALDFAQQHQLIAETDWVFIHDIARPLVTQEEISQLVQAISQYGTAYQGISLGLPIRDSIKHITTVPEQNLMRITQSASRQHIWRSITPQAAPANLLAPALRQFGQHPEMTDEMSALASTNVPCALLPGNEQNIKITTWQDLCVAHALLAQQKTQQKTNRQNRKT